MARQSINLGTAPTGQGGDTFRTASQKNNDNSNELYTALGAPANGQLPAALPVAKGGTGGTTQLAARQGLGLGAASTKSFGLQDGELIPAGVLSGMFSNVAPDAYQMDRPGEPGQQGAFYKFLNNGSSSGLSYSTLLRLPYNTGYEAQIFIPMGTSQLAFRTVTGAAGTFGPTCSVYHTGNTTRGSGGALSAASPILRIANVSASERRDLQEESFLPAGEWGVANDEARGVIVERLGVGEYRVTGSLGLALEGWRTQDPHSPDGGRALGITESEQAVGGAVVIRLFKQRWTLTDDGEMVPGRGAPMDVPPNSWIDVRLEMPKVDTPPPLRSTEE
ncbi:MULTISPECIES: phage tail fiber protein [unclassified Pseudomonas]|uniref:phage tail fiber protein n=1 Tax=unclassified Pseudomonas TaxID=196821 RepID=UPI0018E7D825|nr:MULTISPECIES: hypothetical protein [unclassified Pseudomonas]MBJ2303207.1 hypothetical protein [Pseudomonas sp. MF2846]MBK3490460.1 hypothetical protein [Pseudomonas sp. MF2857]